MAMSMLKLLWALCLPLKNSLCFLTCGIILLSLSITEALAVPESRLWLPSSFRVHMSKLKKAANMVETEAENCAQLISGALHQDLSTKERPIFKFICRNPERRSFALLIDGSNMEVVDSKKPGSSMSFAQLKQKQIQRAEQERLRLEAERQQHFWALCQEELKRRTVNMRDLKWLTLERPAPDMALAGHVRYSVNFDSKDFKGQELHYRGECDYASKEDYVVKIRPRR